MIKNIAIISVTILGLAIHCDQIYAKDFGVGFVLGDPTGVIIHNWVKNERAIQVAVGWKTGNRDEFHLRGDYLVYDTSSIKLEIGYLPFYYGVGLRVLDEPGDTIFGVRVPFGLDYFFTKHPLDVFFEIAPVLDLTPDTDFSIDGGIGLRYRFH